MKYLLTTLLATSTLAPSLAMATETLDYWMWDGTQAPVYQQCATAFEAENPDIKIKLTQIGWDQYWTSLQTG